jgi:ABC-type metal ion transport system, permease component
MLSELFPNVRWEDMWQATYDTLYMTIISTAATFVIGLIVGIVLFLTSPHQIWANKIANFITGSLVNIFRSIPFIVLIILLIPFTKFY